MLTVISMLCFICQYSIRKTDKERDRVKFPVINKQKLFTQWKGIMVFTLDLSCRSVLNRILNCSVFIYV